MRRTYDARNRPKTLTFRDGRGNQSWAYTPDGLPAQITTQNGDGTAAVVNTYAYNKRRLPTGETLSQDGVLSLSLGQGYSANGHLAAQTWPQGLQVTFAPNALGQPTQAGTFASGVQYYPNGAVQQFVYGNGIVHQMQQNARQLPARSTDTGTLDLLTSFDVNGNVSAINDLVQGTGFDRQMQYDANDRLTAAYSPAFGGDGWYRFGYDALDNLRTWTQPGEGQRRYDYDASNRLTGIRNAGGAAIMGFAYDVQGNLSLKNGQGYQFDYGNRLRQATNLERYRYDGHGRRSSVIDAGSGHNRHYLYSQGGALAYLWDQGTGEYTQYIQLAGSLVATRKVDAGGAAVVRYQHTDALGSPVAETNQQAVVVQRTAYTPYGASIGAQKDGVGYTGHVMDGSTGLTYMQQRYMDPSVGAFLSVDPVTAHSQPVGSFHRYRYANGSPYRFNDPDGRSALESDRKTQTATTGSHIKGGGVAAGSRMGILGQVGGGQQAAKYGREPRSTDPSWTRDPKLRSQMEDAWQDSNPDAPPVRRGQGGSLKRENGGWVVQFAGEDDFDLVRSPAGSRDRMSMESTVKPSEFICGCIVKGYFHTHPNTLSEGYVPGANGYDYQYQIQQGVPGMIRSHEGYEFIPIPGGK